MISSSTRNRGYSSLAVSPTTQYLHSFEEMQLPIIDDQASGSTQSVEILTTILSQVSLHLAANTPRTPSSKRLPVKFKQRPGPRKQPIAVVPRWVPPAVATPSRAKKCRTVEFKLRVLSWAEHTQVDDRNGGQRKPTRKEVQVRFGLKQKNQVPKLKKVHCEMIRLLQDITNYCGLHRMRHCCFKQVNTPYVYGAATHGGRNLRNNYAMRLRSGKNSDALYAASGSSVPRRNCSLRSILIPLLNFASPMAGSLGCFTAMISHFASSQTKLRPHRCSIVR